MRRHYYPIIVFGLCLALAVCAAVTEKPDVRCKQASIWGAYDHQTELFQGGSATVVEGKVLSVESVAPVEGVCSGIAIKLKMSNETITVYAGPKWYIQLLAVSLAAGSTIQVRGSRTSINGHSVIIASEINKEDQVLLLRDRQGFPLWSDPARWPKRRTS